jgi:uncharacterized phage-associated protein
MENPIAIANYFISKSLASGEELTPMKLIKLVYISHGWYLAITNEPLLSEGVQAWKYGPVVNSVYRGTKKFGKGQVTEMLFDTRTMSFPVPTNPQVIALLERIWAVYGKYNGLELSALTHQDGTPWDITWNVRHGKSHNAVVISNDLIKDHYRSKLNPTANGQPADHLN